MLDKVIFLETYATAGSLDQVFNQLEQAGVFRYALPFLFIFALVFGILSRTKIFDQTKGINVIISLAVGIMVLQTDFVSNFFSLISPMLGIGLIVLLVAMIFLGLVAPKEAWLVYVIFGIAAIILINILLGVAQATNSVWYDWWVQWKGMIIFVTVVLIVILSVIGSTSGNSSNFADIASDAIKKIAG